MTQPLGVDVSQWQATTLNLTGLSFLFARASIALQADTMYAKHIAKARSAGLVTGAYHFGNDQVDPATQAAVFLKAAGDVDFYFLDVEGRHAMSYPQIKAFFAAVHKAGKSIGLYGSESGFPQLGQDYSWIANWSSTPSIPWDFHQYRGSPLDLDRFNGTLAELRALAGGLPDSSTGGDMGEFVVPFAKPVPFTVTSAGRFTPNPPSPDLNAVSGTVQAEATVYINQTAVPHGAFLRIITGTTGRRLVIATDASPAAAPAVDCSAEAEAARKEAAAAATSTQLQNDQA